MEHNQLRFKGPNGPEAIGVMWIPRRKSPCLYHERKGTIKPLAYFRSNADAQAFDDVIGALGEAFAKAYGSREEEMDTTIEEFWWPRGMREVCGGKGER